MLKSAELMRAADPDLKLLAAATPNRDWTLPLLKTAGDASRLRGDPRVLAAVLGQQRDARLPDLRVALGRSGADHRRVIDLLEESGHRGRIKIAFDEWNLRGWHHPGFPRKQVER